MESLDDEHDQEKVKLSYLYRLATIKNLQTILRQKPIGIHFSGHGLENNPETLMKIVSPNDKSKLLDKGDILVFEDD